MKTFPAKAGDLAQLLECHLTGDADQLITGANTIERAESGDLTFLANPRYRKYLPDCRAGAIILSEESADFGGCAQLICTDPYNTFRRAIEILYGEETTDVSPGVHPSAVIGEGVELGDDISIGPCVTVSDGVSIGARTTVYSGVFIGRSVIIGDDCIIGANVSLRHNVSIGSRVLIGDGTIIGYDGFGYVPQEHGYDRIRPVGIIIIEDDVHIGANCCIDRATVGFTKIGKGSKLDNLIQIAHGVEIGENTAIAAQTGISGSARIGSWVIMGGQVGLVGHIDIGDRMQIGAQAGVTKSCDSASLITGYPARPVMEVRRIDAALTQLPELLKRVKALEKKLDDLGK